MGGSGVAEAPPPKSPITIDSELKLAVGSDGVNEVVCDVSQVRRREVMDQLIASWNRMVAIRTEARGLDWITPAERKFRLKLVRWLLVMGNSANPTTDWILKIAETFKGKRKRHGGT